MGELGRECDEAAALYAETSGDWDDRSGRADFLLIRGSDSGFRLGTFSLYYA
jgi:hypothetical protein